MKALTASYLVVGTLSLVIIFHILVLIGVIPYTIVWGGRITTFEQMVVFEAISITLNTVMILAVAAYSGIVTSKINRKFLRIGLFAMVILFSLNTVGNLFSENELERMIFTPITLILALLIGVILRSSRAT